MGAHKGLLDRLNEVTNNLKTTANDLRYKSENSPVFKQYASTSTSTLGQPPQEEDKCGSSSVDAVRQAVLDLEIDNEIKDASPVKQTDTETRLAQSRRRFEESARQRAAIEETKKQRQKLLEAKQRAREAEEISRIRAEREAEKKQEQLKREAELVRLEAARDAELARLEREQEAALFLEQQEQEEAIRQREANALALVAKQNAAKEEAAAAAARNEIARISAQVKKAQRDEAAKAVQEQTVELRRREEALRARKLDGEAKARPNCRLIPPVLAAIRGEEEVFESQQQQSPNVPIASTFRSGWTSTPTMNNEDAFVRAPSGLSGTGYYKWNAFLPQPPGSQPKIQPRGVDFRAACSSRIQPSTTSSVPTESINTTGIESTRFSDAPTNASSEEESTNTIFLVEPTPPIRDYCAAVDAYENTNKKENMDDDDISSIHSSVSSSSASEISVEPPWSAVARRRSDARRNTAANSQAKEKNILEDLIPEANCCARTGSLPDGSNAVTVEAVRRAVVAAIRNMSPEDLDSEVTSYDMNSGLFRVESKVKIASGQIVAMAVERSWADFIKVRDGLLKFIGKDEEAQDLARAILTKIPRKRFKSIVKAKARNLFNGAERGELKWQSKQVAKLDIFINSAVNLVAQIKAIATFKDDTFSW
eukprot:CAMPEP_0197290982 /NCGR_PEP_ID=MMETSP0890-20130614/10414_1 /TAXON_ID=44058 ORGANISM="Aureoumbra lagunensis, Strain CCMP1510" /NCGR_SAMPLE_ID=MMETSP0890 /ASSEMBLY_ACC=CAM_ASM_000533 /LENGTH=651 /DNA_ID=CAMNT_0042763407 /DNA_START=145 /DNA_END=2097 /DNA_ORIENTATION=+